MKMAKGKIILMVLGLLLGAGVALGATLAFGETLGITGKPGETKIKYIEKPKVGMMLPMRERIVNLSDPGVMRYLKVTITLEMANHSGKDLPTGEKYKEAQTELKNELGGTLPRMEDELTVILTARTSAELMNPDGKQRLRDEIKSRMNKALEKLSPDPLERHEVLGVYFNDFIIQ
ncbi:MAG: flagellar basal body-associated protein FliL [Chloroflexota bacterium]